MSFEYKGACNYDNGVIDLCYLRASPEGHDSLNWRDFEYSGNSRRCPGQIRQTMQDFQIAVLQCNEIETIPTSYRLYQIA